MPGAWLNQAIFGGHVEPKVLRFVPRTLPPAEPVRQSRAAREREAKAYWNALSPQPEAWVLKKMRFGDFGCTPQQ
jgi:hypothetical protein